MGRPIETSKLELDQDLEHFISQMLLQPGTALLNAGSYSPIPRPVFERAHQLRLQLAENPNQFYWRSMPQLIDIARQALKRDLNCKVGDLLLMPNTTMAINMVLYSLLKPGLRVLTMDHEYGALDMALKTLGHSRKIVITRVVLKAEHLQSQSDMLRRFQETGKGGFDILYTSHVTSPTGAILPIKQLITWAKEQGARTIIDGAHAPGMIPLDLDGLHPDFYAGNCHKWMMTPTGAAFLYVDPKGRPDLKPLILSWGLDYADSQADEPSGWGGSFWERNLEFHGSQDRTSQLVIPEAIRFRKEIGDANIAKRVGILADYAVEQAQKIGLKPLIVHRRDPETGEPLRHAMTAFPFRKLRDLHATMAWLGVHRKAEVAFTANPSGDQFLRISTAWFNREQEIDHLVNCLSDIPENRLK